MQDVLIMSYEGKSLESTMDFGKTKVYSALLLRLFQTTIFNLIKPIDSDDELRLIRLCSANAELLVAP